MRKITYNLASNRKIAVKKFAFNMAILGLAVILLNGMTILNLTKQQRRNRSEKSEIRTAEQKMKEMQLKSLLLQKEIAALKKTRRKQITWANSMITRKAFSFIARFDFLESALSEGITVRNLTMVNEQKDKISLTINTGSLNQLLKLYNTLAKHELVITSENQGADGYQVNLDVKYGDEKK
jgi:hypothetical protein